MCKNSYKQAVSKTPTRRERLIIAGVCQPIIPPKKPAYHVGLKGYVWIILLMGVTLTFRQLNTHSPLAVNVFRIF